MVNDTTGDVIHKLWGLGNSIEQVTLLLQYIKCKGSRENEPID